MSRGPFALAAEGMARAGFLVLPLRVRGKVPLTANGVRDATADLDVVAWWARTWPSANLGVACGLESGLVVIDLDGAGGREGYGALLAEHGPPSVNPRLPDGASVRTGSGWHLWLAWPEGRVVRNSAGKLARGVDVRGAGGFVVAPPSVHPSGRVYAWGDRPRHGLPAIAPAWCDLLDPPEVRRAPPAPRRWTDTASAYGRAAAVAEARRVMEAEVGTRNATLNAAAFALGRLVGGGELPEEETLEMLVDAGRHAGLGPREARRTAEGGMAAGVREPRAAPREVWA